MPIYHEQVYNVHLSDGKPNQLVAGHEMKPTKRGRKGHHRVSYLCVRGRVVISCLGCKYTFVHCVISVLEGESENKLLLAI